MSSKHQGPSTSFFWKSLQSIKRELKGSNNNGNKIISKYEACSFDKVFKIIDKNTSVKQRDLMTHISMRRKKLIKDMVSLGQEKKKGF